MDLDRLIRNSIEDLIEDFICKEDQAYIDAIWTYGLSLPSNTAFHDKAIKGSIDKCMKFVIQRNLRIKHKSNLKETGKIIKKILAFQTDTLEFLNKHDYENHRNLLFDVLNEKTSKDVLDYFETTRMASSKVQMKIVPFLKNLYPILAKVVNIDCEYEDRKLFGNYDIQRRGILGIHYYKLDQDDITFLFNHMYGERLDFETIADIVPLNQWKMINPTPTRKVEYKFSSFGDEIIRMGMGYWMCCVSCRDNTHYGLVIPQFVFDYLMQLETVEKAYDFEYRTLTLMGERETIEKIETMRIVK